MTLQELFHKCAYEIDYESIGDSGKLRIKGDDKVYSQATELKDKPREYEEVID